MKKTLSILMIILLVSPVFATWLPDNVILSLHKNNLEHYVMGNHSHSGHQHGHEHSISQQSQQEHGHKDKHDNFNQDTTLSDHHPIHFDITTYFSDTLNVELQRTGLSSTNLTVFDFSDFSSLLVTFKKRNTITTFFLAKAISRYIGGYLSQTLFLHIWRLRI
jgi:hypothetical protein